ncbi:uncharacterized protein LOC128213120 [Mya arenaria]|uniref:uncharacterized protein LOC128213120 n=1 Tax=Mya arenaria TaxID=6604 RepID=UPI0022E7F26C|nr:uncharacterized protein LOC128213120 [Mya arenaria]XP_052774611.1 uncharacterized protein LOC128213120 [Mya arenaria]
MDRDLEGKQAMSLKLSKVLGDIGVNRDMVKLRRKTWLTIEKHQTAFSINSRISSLHYFHFGSQTEGTTTLGMESDADILCLGYEHLIMLEMSEWQPGRIETLLVLKNEHSPPQHCILQMIRPDRPMPVTLNIVKGDSYKHIIEVDKEGRVLLKSSRLRPLAKTHFGNQYIKKGPSISFSKYVDFVFALPCIRRPDECKYLFRRPRPGHWPRPAILAEAMQTATYLVHQGHPESCHPELEWRFSTPLIERLLIFDLNIIQLKVYTFLKILRKNYFKPDFDDRLSTYHMKTVMMFTVESYPPNIWEKNDLLHCVIYCLTTLRRWCRMHYCPHYTISGVNLFVGKLKKFELTRLSAMLSDMIENISKYVVDIKMDRLGERMLMLPGTNLHTVNLLSRYDNKLKILRFCLGVLLNKFCHLSFNLGGPIKESASELNIRYSKVEKTCHSFIRDTEEEFTRDAFSMLIKSLNILLASVQASVCIASHQDITEEISAQFQKHMDFDLSSGRLKFSAMLYCDRQYERAAAVLEDIEGFLHDDVWQFSLQKRDTFRPTFTFLSKALDMPVSEIVKTSVAPSVTFVRQELHCVPKHVVYEMYKSFTRADDQRRKIDYGEMDCAIFESVPFLYYLQYVSYRKLGQHDKKSSAIRKLSDYLQDKGNWHGHIETAYNILGHCNEMENRQDLAYQCYSRSIRLFPYNNAARWHMAIILNKLIQKMTE